MRRAILLVSLVLLVFVVSSTSCAETLVTLDTRILPVDSSVPRYPTINTLLLGGDTLVVGAWNGVWLQCDKTQDWRMLIGAVAPRDWWADCDKKTCHRHLFMPKPLWRVPNSNDIMVFEGHCNTFLKLRLGNIGDSGARVWWDPHDDGIAANAVNLQQDLILARVWTEDDALLVGLGRTTEPGFTRRIFKVTASLDEYLDSLWIDWEFCLPALNPRDSTIWLSIFGYSYLGIVDRNGNLLDSVEIVAPDFIPPSPPISRMKSDAVFEDWVSRWTPQTDFRYVPPGYFLLQYRTGWTKLTAQDSVRLLSTCAWNDQRQPVELEVDSNWTIAGVHPDGRLVFAHSEASEVQNKIVLTITRIEP